MKTNMRYAVRATITDPEGKLIWTTDTVHSVDPTRFEQDLGRSIWFALVTARRLQA
ncbi:hypothetical protein G432_20150 (plasmid) [Sphingomonas sp. MM-1]|uniref:hypothetical protein n=1 Tax=Sphingomonas sp. MM-1 TaxID=745310 RepID=UPI0002C0618D|nr:hypothetical protein [Sphingomonas sp. MM-1]AGH51715.1 hypothetical protein G432_20150 [Sphingomonas sp. MM-1]